MEQRIHINILLDIMIVILCVTRPQMTDYTKKFYENATMSFRVNYKHLLKNYNKIWEKLKS